MQGVLTTDLAARLLEERSITPEGCWLWTGAKFSDGYGQVEYQHRPWRVHRVAAALWLGFGEGLRKVEIGLTKSMLVVMHSCDVPLCFNPDHLVIGTTLDNRRDSIAKGRWHGNRKVALGNNR